MSICYSFQNLQDVEKFSDIEKLYLYLKLPSGPSNTSEKCDQSVLSSSRTQQMHAFNWIRNHLEEYPETSLPKQEVYDEYKSFCDNLNYHPLSAADFGKMMKNVFPNMKARRLGMRGKSKYPSYTYCYSGLRKRPFVHVPSLPSLDLHKTGEGCDILDSPAHLSGIKEDVRFAACDLVCEWAQKVLKRQFDAVEDLACFLVSSHFISNKSLAALTVMTGVATGKTPLSNPAFVLATDIHTLQSQVTTLSPPTVDAKQQLQRKIQRKQELKLHSPTPPEGQNQDESMHNLTTPSPQPPLGIVVAAVPSPIMAQTCRQLISPSPAMESKVLPLNFHMVTQSISNVKQSLKSTQNAVYSSAGSARQRYPQILPKPLSTSAIALRSPSTMIFANSPIKTVMTSCHVSPVSLVKMAAISLAPNSQTATTSLTSATLRPTSAGISSPAISEECRPNQTIRSASTVPILVPMTMPGQTVDSSNTDVEMEVEAIHESSQRHFAYPCGEVKQRAASVPIPQTKELFGVGEVPFSTCNEKPSLSTVTVTNITKSNDKSNHISSLHSTLSTNNTSPSSSMHISNTQVPVGSRNIPFARGGIVSPKNQRKRPGFSPDICSISPSKRFFVPKPLFEGAADPEYGARATVTLKQGGSTRPESAPASREIEIMTSQSYTCSSSFGGSSFYSVAKMQSLGQRKNTPVMEGITSPSHALFQQLTHSNASKPAAKEILGSYSSESDNRAHHIYSVPSYTTNENMQFINQDISTNSITMQPDIDYFSFDDDVTQDSIVEELVQMEEQMKLNLKDFSNCHSLQSQQPEIQDNMTLNYQPINSCYPATNSHFLTRESPCSRMASTTPVDSALGSSRHTPVGTPHSNCSSTVPPSPVECRNPFAFTPINSSNTAFHDINVASSPVKPMQRPTATHPDKTRLEWMNNSYDNSSSTITKSNSGMGIVPSYQGLIDNHFQKPHAFAVPHARYQENAFGRLTPISPVQQQVASMTNMSKQEGFAVPAPLDNKTNNHSTSFRCRSVSPAVHQKNLSANSGNGALSNVPRSVLSPFNSPVTPELFNLFSNTQSNLGASCMAQRSRSVPLNIMMQTQEMPPQGQPSSTKHLGTVLMNKLERSHDDTVRGLGLNNVASSYSACMNLSQILESDGNLPCNDHLLSPDSTNPCYPHPETVHEHQLTDQTPQQMIHHKQLDFSCTVKEMVPEDNLTAGSVEQDLNTGTNFHHELRMTADDLNALDTNLLFDPNQQQGKYLRDTSEELVNNSMFQQISGETTHSGGLDWLESKDNPAVGLMG
uniref:Regulatory factor X7 n=1 Tax=Neogobius melanostomus TaxID=47308 RepID=A0A8C6ULH0_9GOBI